MKLAGAVLAAGLLAAASLSASPASAQGAGWKPTGPVSVVVHTGPGGGGDAFARAFITALDRDKVLDTTMVVVNKVGGGSTAAMNYLNEKAGDPNTIGVFTSVWVTDGLVQSEAKVTLPDLTPISRLVLEPALLVVRADSPYKNLKDFIEAAKAAPGKLKQSGGSVTARDAVMRHVLMASTKADWAFVSFPGGGERIAALLGGHVDMMMIEPVEAGELIRAGRLRAIAQVTDKRLPNFPDVPTIQEQGFEVPNVPQARGIVGPPNMPPEAVAYFQNLFLKASKSPSYIKYLNDTQLENAYLDPAATKGFITDYANTLRTILQGAGVKVVR
ncbi:tripartite tricarboxylate transporter substrate binding protein [Bosea sp. 117]|uniref:Bug family tripartite tricarboxylate transporter substrate binding protein n=1 Tax=Bosea sp. 117 TaxID=1125973 RepID=UPI0004942B6D|nr:tripartite tricarboxylate transporter substrate binding protein [Bosea sp. 117]